MKQSWCRSKDLRTYLSCSYWECFDLSPLWVVGHWPTSTVRGQVGSSDNCSRRLSSFVLPDFEAWEVLQVSPKKGPQSFEFNKVRHQHTNWAALAPSFYWLFLYPFMICFLFFIICQHLYFSTACLVSQRQFSNLVLICSILFYSTLFCSILLFSGLLYSVITWFQVHYM